MTEKKKYIKVYIEVTEKKKYIQVYIEVTFVGLGC